MLCTLETIKSYLNIDATDEHADALLNVMIKNASAFFENACNRIFTTANYVDVLSGNGKTALVLMNYPVQSVSKLVVSGREINSADYRVADDLLILSKDIFAKGLKNIEVHYTAGYDEVPFDIQQAVIETVALRFKERDRIGQQSKSLAGETVSFYIKDLSPSARATANQYKRVVHPA